MKPQFNHYFMPIFILLTLFSFSKGQWKETDLKGDSLENLIIEDFKKRSQSTRIQIEGDSTPYIESFLARAINYMNNLETLGYWKANINVDVEGDIKKDILISQIGTVKSLPFTKEGYQFARNEPQFYFELEDGSRKVIIATNPNSSLTFNSSKAQLKGTKMDATLYIIDEVPKKWWEKKTFVIKKKECPLDVYISFKDFATGHDIDFREPKPFGAIYYELLVKSIECPLTFTSKNSFIYPGTERGFLDFLMIITYMISTLIGMIYIIDTERKASSQWKLKQISSYSFTIIGLSGLLFEEIMVTFLMLKRDIWGILLLPTIFFTSTNIAMSLMCTFKAAYSRNAQRSLWAFILEIILNLGLAIILYYQYSFSQRVSYHNLDWYLLPAAFYLSPQIWRAFMEEYILDYLHLFGMLPAQVVPIIYARSYPNNIFMQETNHTFTLVYLAIVAVQVFISLAQGGKIRNVFRRPQVYNRADAGEVEMRNEPETA